MTDWADKRVEKILDREAFLQRKKELMAQSFRDLVEECCKEVCNSCKAGIKLHIMRGTYIHYLTNTPSVDYECNANKLRQNFSSERLKADEH